MYCASSAGKKVQEVSGGEQFTAKVAKISSEHVVRNFEAGAPLAREIRDTCFNYRFVYAC